MPSLLLLIEFLDELVFGVTEAAWPLIRDDLGLNYAQIGLALSLPGFFSTFTEPFIVVPGAAVTMRIVRIRVENRSRFHRSKGERLARNRDVPPSLRRIRPAT